MKKCLILFIALVLISCVFAQTEPEAGTWKTWFISSGKDYRLPPPETHQDELNEILAVQRELDEGDMAQITYWNAGPPGYRWQELISKLWMRDTSYHGALAYMLLNAAIYDATIAAWDTKYAYKRPRPFECSEQILALTIKPESPSYPCEHSVAAGVATTIISHFYPFLTDSVNRMAERLLASRIMAGVAFPGDTRAGFELGKRIAEKEIEYTKNFTVKGRWDGKRPQDPGIWQGAPLFPLAGQNKTVVLKSSSQFRPGPPPDWEKDMAELKNFKQTFYSKANAFHYASGLGDNILNTKIFEYNLHLNPPRAARIYAAAAIGTYDGFVACWDAKYTYWGTRPDQYDTTYHALIPTPPFPGYPSGHAVISGMSGDLFSYFFPADKEYFQKIAKDGAESRFHGGIHFRTDNEVGLELGRKVADAVIQRLENDGCAGERR